jgi:hypothetical protein
MLRSLIFKAKYYFVFRKNMFKALVLIKLQILKNILILLLHPNYPNSKQSTLRDLGECIAFQLPK